MQLSSTAILWLHLLLPVLSILLSPYTVAAMARVQQHKAKALANFLNLKSKAAVAAARAKHPQFYRRLSNSVKKHHAVERPKRQAPEPGMKLFDEASGFAQPSLVEDANRVIDLLHNEQMQNFNVPPSVDQPQQITTGENIPTNSQLFQTPDAPRPVFPNPDFTTANNNMITSVPQVPQNNAGFSSENASPSNNMGAVVGSNLDQQNEALSQLQNMWNMNGFGKSQNSDFTRENAESTLRSPDPHSFAQSPKVHSKAFSMVKDKNTGATTISFSSYDKWRQAKDNNNIVGMLNDEDQDTTTINPEFLTPDFIKWQKEKIEEAKFNAAIQHLINNPPKTFEEAQKEREEKEKLQQLEKQKQTGGQPQARTSGMLDEKIFSKKLKLHEKKPPAIYYSTNSGPSGYGDGAEYNSRNAENEDSTDENPEMTMRLAKELEDENKNFPDHDPNHPGHVDGRCADVDDKLYKIYEKKLSLLYKKLNKKNKKKTYNEDNHHDDYNDGYYTYDNNNAYRNAETQTENSTEPKVGEANPAFSSENNQIPNFISHPLVRESEITEVNEESIPQGQLREPFPHFKGSLIHGQTHHFKKDFGEQQGPQEAVQINLNANSFANTAAGGGSFQQQPAAAGSFTNAAALAGSSFQQPSVPFNNQQSSAQSFANAGASIQTAPVWGNQNNFNSGFINQGGFSNGAQSNAEASANSFQQGGFFNGGQSNAEAPANIFQEGEFSNGAQSNANGFLSGGQSNFQQGGFQNGAQSNAQASSNNFQPGGFSSGAQSNAQASANSFQQGGFSSGAQSKAQASSSSFQGGFSSGAQAGAQASANGFQLGGFPTSFTQSPVTFGFANANANAGGQWVGAASPILEQEYMIDGESLVASNKFVRDVPISTNQNEMSFVTNIVDQSLKLGNQANSQRTSGDGQEFLVPVPQQQASFITNIVDQSLKLGGQVDNLDEGKERENTDDIEKSPTDSTVVTDKKQKVFDTMNFVTGIVDFGINEHKKNTQRRVKRQAMFPRNEGMSQQNNPMNFQEFQNMQQQMGQTGGQFAPMQMPNFFVNQEIQNIPQNMFGQMPQMEQRSAFPEITQKQPNFMTPQRDNFQQNSLLDSQRQQQDVLKAFPEMNNQALHFQENFENNQGFRKEQQMQSSQQQDGPLNENKPNTDFDKQNINLNKSQQMQEESQQNNNLQMTSVNIQDEKDDEIITAPLLLNLRDNDNSSEESKEKTSTSTTSTVTHASTTSTTMSSGIPPSSEHVPVTTQSKTSTVGDVHPTPKAVPTQNEGPIEKKNVTISKPNVLDILHQAGISEVFKTIDEELKILTPEQKQKFIKQELELLTEMVMERLKNGSVHMKLPDTYNNNNSTTQKQDSESSTTEKVLTSDEPIVRNIIQVPYNYPSFARARDYYRSAENFADTPLGMQNAQNQFDTILGMHQESVQNLKDNAHDDGDLLMISWIGDGIVKDLENRRAKTFTKHKREIPALKSDMLSVTKLVSDPTAKIDVTKTFDNLGSVTRHVIENTKAPMYHVRSMLGNAKNSVMAAVKAAPNNLILPSKYEIAEVNDDARVGAINKKLLKEKIIEVAEKRKKLGKQETDFGITDTFSKLGSILKESVDSGKQSVAHANDAAMDARNVLYTAKHAVPQIITPLNPLPGLAQSNALPKKGILLTPRILEVSENSNILEKETPDFSEKFVGAGEIFDSLGLTNPDKNDIEIEKIVMQPETVQVLRQWNKGRPKNLRSTTDVKNWLKSNLKENRTVGNKIHETIEDLDKAKQALGAKDLRDMLAKMRLQMKQAVKEHLNIITKQRQKLRKSRILKKYRGIPVRKESSLNRKQQEGQVTPGENIIPNFNSRINDVTDKPNNMKKDTVLTLVHEEEPTVTLPTSTTTTVERTERSNTVGESLSANEGSPVVINDVQTVPSSETEHHTEQTTENLNEKLGLYLTPDLMRPFMGRASETELNQFWRENNDLEDIGTTNMEKPKNQLFTITSTTVVPNILPVTRSEMKNPDTHQNFDNEGLTQKLGAKIQEWRKNNDKDNREATTSPTPNSLPQVTSTTTKPRDTHHDFNDDVLTHIVGAKNPRMFEKFFNQGFQNTPERNAQELQATSDMLQNVKQQQEQSGNRNTERPTPDLETQKPAEIATAGTPPTKPNTSESSEVSEKARFQLVPSKVDLYKKPFMGTLDKNLIKEFLRKYNQVEDSSEER